MLPGPLKQQFMEAMKLLKHSNVTDIHEYKFGIVMAAANRSLDGIFRQERPDFISIVKYGTHKMIVSLKFTSDLVSIHVTNSGSNIVSRRIDSRSIAGVIDRSDDEKPGHHVINKRRDGEEELHFECSSDEERNLWYVLPQDLLDLCVC